MVHPSQREKLPKFDSIPQAYRYNESARLLIKRLQVADQLREAGHDINIANREEIVQVYRDTKAAIIRAIETERIFRENPDVRASEIIPETPDKPQLQDEMAKEWGDLLDNAFSIQLKTQERLKSLMDAK